MTEKTDPRDIEAIQVDESALPIPVICHRTEREIDYSDGLVFLEDGMPVDHQFSKQADEVLAVERHYGHHKNTGPYTEWLTITRRESINPTLKERVDANTPIELSTLVVVTLSAIVVLIALGVAIL